jgi:undecaprenyl-diphosphatase
MAMNPVFGYLSDSDFRLSDRLRVWRPPRFVRIWMLWATRLGDGWLWLSIGLFLLTWGGHAHRVLAAAAVSTAVANAVLVLLKRCVRRARPCDYGPNPFFEVRPLGYFPSDRFSFPSGHALNAFAINTVVALQYPVAAPVLGLVAASVAASRVVLGLHFLSDVVVGAALGTLIGAAAFGLVLG